MEKIIKKCGIAGLKMMLKGGVILCNAFLAGIEILVNVAKEDWR